jgi:DNA-binding NtrC family response regulator
MAARIAVADDDPGFLGLLDDILTLAGYVPMLLDDETTAIATLSERVPDAILLDIRMAAPDSGMQRLRQVPAHGWRGGALPAMLVRITSVEEACHALSTLRVRDDPTAA